MPERLRVGHDEIVVHVTSAETGGDLLVADIHMPPGGGPPGLHRHVPSEVYRVIEGRFALYLEDEHGTTRRHELGEGDVHAVPGGREHTVRNESDSPARAHVVFAPGAAMERFVRAAAELGVTGPPEPTEVMALAQRHGIEMTRLLPASATTGG